MQTAFKDFVAAFLPETPTEMAVVDFDNEGTVTQAFTSNETDLNTAIDATISGGNTNWDDALLEGRALFPHRATYKDLIVFASDGNPNRRGGHTGPLAGHTGGVVTVTEQVAMNFATDESDQAKTDNIRILALGIGSGLDVVNLKAISGNVEHPPAPVDENVDVITSDFSSLATDLAALADGLCPGDIFVHKVIDGDGNLGTTGDQTNFGAGWTFAANVDPPDTYTCVPVTCDTDGASTTHFIIDVGVDSMAVVDITEPGETGYGFLSVSCTSGGGSAAFQAVNNIMVNQGDIINCTFINVPLGMIEWEKGDESAAGPPHPLQGGATFTVGGANGPFYCLNILTNPITVVDNGLNDADPDPGQIKVNDVCPGAYTVTETVAPSGYARDDDTTRSVTVASPTLNQVIGAKGTDEDGNTDESDFHNRLGMIEWEKRNEALSGPPHALQGGATFTVGGPPGPFACNGDATNPVMVVDNGLNDADPDPGQIKLNNVCLGSYTVTETVAPSGYALDDDATRAVTVSEGDLNQVIGTQGTDEDGNTDESDFHNRLGMLEWEKRKETGSPPHPLQGGATFTVGGASGPFFCTGDATNPVTVVDNSPPDADPDPGQIKVNNVCLGTYTITETVAPAGFALDNDATRAVTVSNADLNAVIGTQGTDEDGDTDESDFHNRLGMIEWEKRFETGSPPHALQGGATFTVGGPPGPFACNGDATNPVMVVDNGLNDADPDPGQIKLNNVCLGSYTVTETVAPSGGYLPDDDPTRAVIVSLADLNAVIGAQGTDEDGNSDESDFHNTGTGTIVITKDAQPNDPQDFSFSGTCFAPFSLDDDGTNSNPLSSSMMAAHVAPSSCTVIEDGPPAGWVLTLLVCTDPDSGTTTNLGTRTATIDLDPGETVSCTFTDKPTAQFIVNKDFVPNDPATVTVTLVCTSGTVANDDPTASEADPANFTVTGFGSSTTCTATEIVPGGYAADQSNCLNVAISPGGTSSCTITNNATATPTPPPPDSPTPTPGPATATPAPTPTPTPAPPVGGIAGLLDTPLSPQSVEPAGDSGSPAWPLVLVATGVLSAVSGVYLARRRCTG